MSGHSRTQGIAFASGQEFVEVLAHGTCIEVCGSNLCGRSAEAPAKSRKIATLQAEFLAQK